METLKVGDVVQSKAGGPPMTLTGTDGSKAYCQWFANADLRMGTFPIASLEPVEPAPDKK